MSPAEALLSSEGLVSRRAPVRVEKRAAPRIGGSVSDTPRDETRRSPLATSFGPRPVSARSHARRRAISWWERVTEALWPPCVTLRTMAKDFLAEIVDERTRKNAAFPTTPRTTRSSALAGSPPQPTSWSSLRASRTGDQARDESPRAPRGGATSRPVGAPRSTRLRDGSTASRRSNTTRRHVRGSRRRRCRPPRRWQRGRSRRERASGIGPSECGASWDRTPALAGSVAPVFSKKPLAPIVREY